jgi:hypothetical protein
MIRRIAAAGFLLLAVSSPAAADAESEALFRNFVAWVDASNEWSATVSVVRSEGRDTFAEGLVFSREAPHVGISIEEVRLKDLKERAGGGFTAAEMEMTAGAVLGEGFEAAIPSAELWGVALPSLAGVTLDPAHLMTSMSRFYTLAAEGELAEMSVPEISLTQSAQTPDSTTQFEVEAVYRGLSLAEMADGVIRRQEIGPISISSNKVGEEFELEIEKGEADRVDIGAFAHILDPTAYRNGRGDNIWRPLTSRIVYRGLSGSGEDGTTFKVDEMAIEGVDGRQTEKPFTDVWDRIIDASVPEDMKDDLAIEALTSIFGAWRVGTIRLDGTSLEAPKDNVSFSLASLSASGWSNAGLDSFLLKGLRGRSPDGFLTLQTLELAGFISPDLKALMKFAALEKEIDPAKHADAIKAAFAALPRLAHFGLHDAAAGKSEAESASLANFTVDFADWNPIYAGATDIRLEGLTVPRALLELDMETSAMLDTLGYDELVIGASLSDRWDPETGTDDATWTLSLKNAADVEISYRLTGITLDWLMQSTAAAGASEDSSAALTAMLSDLGVAAATVSVTDRSLLDRAFAVAAEKQGLSVDGAAYREQMRAALPFIISAAVPAEVANLVTKPLQAFLAGGQRIFADASPSTPLRVLDLMQAAADPMTLPTLLNLTLRAETPPQQTPQ